MKILIGGRLGQHIASFFDRTSVNLVGVTLRNTDDCAFTSRQSFVGEFADMVNTIRKHTNALIMLGGVGLSVTPEEVTNLCKADADRQYGILGLPVPAPGRQVRARACRFWRLIRQQTLALKPKRIP